MGAHSSPADIDVWINAATGQWITTAKVRSRHHIFHVPSFLTDYHPLTGHLGDVLAAASDLGFRQALPPTLLPPHLLDLQELPSRQHGHDRSRLGLHDLLHHRLVLLLRIGHCGQLGLAGRDW